MTALYPFDTETYLNPDWLKNTFNTGYSILLKNHIRQLIDRTGVYSADETDLWGEAYVDADGRNDSVDTTVSENSATFDIDKLRTAKITDVFASNTSGDTSINTSYELGQTIDCNSMTVSSASGAIHIANASYTASLKITYNYVDTTTASAEYSTNATGFETKTYVNPNPTKTVDTIDFEIKTTNSSYATTLGDCFAYRNLQDYAEIEHTIPSGTFSSTISSAIGSFIPEDWESGADVQFKLTGTGGAEDTDWLDTNETQSFTAFTAEPDTLIVKLIPKTTSPTAGYPSIKGFSLIAR